VSNAAERAGSILRVIGRVERAVSSAAFMLLVAVLFGDVLSRELTGTGLTWARETGVLANLVLTLVGIGIASAAGTHLRPRFADGWLPSGWNDLVEVASEWVMAVFCLAFAYLSFLAAMETAALDERFTVLRWPVWPFQMVIPAVFVVALVRHGLFALHPRLRPGRDPTGADANGATTGNR
jgi:TRAP-type C4-dicarboxylate transport system permease small subunit